jgi:hypothetical protein
VQYIVPPLQRISHLYIPIKGIARPNSHIHVSVSGLYIPRIGPHIFSYNKIGRPVERLLLKEGNPISLVFQSIDPPPTPPGECVPPAFVGGEDTLARRRGGWGVNILEDERHLIALLQ